MAIDTLIDGVARQKILLDLSTDSHWGGSAQRLLASKVADVNANLGYLLLASRIL
jgi:hypothetical protein